MIARDAPDYPRAGSGRFGALSPRKTRLMAAAGALVLLGLGLLLRLKFASIALGNFSVNADEAISFLEAKYISQGHTPLLFWTQPYQFPFEAYFMANFFDWLPWDSLGVRIVQITICFLSFCCFLLIFGLLGSWRTVWPGVILVLFPSAYWLTRQVGLLTPQHSMMMLMACLIPLTVGVSKRSSLEHRWCLAGGIACGMALSNHLLSLSLVVPAALALCFSKTARQSLKNTAWFLPGVFFGLLPYLYAKLFVPGAYHKVSDTAPLSDIPGRLMSPAIWDQVTTALGVYPHIFPDGGPRLGEYAFLVQPALVLFLGLLGLLTLLRARAFFVRLMKDRWPTFELNDVFLGTVLLAVLLLSVTGLGLRPRYALHIVWCFPFLYSYAYGVMPRLGRLVMGALALAIVAFNLHTTFRLMDYWRQPGFSARYANLFNLDSTYEFLRENGANRCYAGWWLAYRIIFDSKEKIICSPPFNDRFPTWPQPYYSKIVQLSENPPYVFGKYVHRMFRYGQFGNYLTAHRIVADRVNLNPYHGYSNFRHEDVESSKLVPFELVSAEVSHNPEHAVYLSDGKLDAHWSSAEEQQKGMTVSLELPKAVPIHALRMFSRDKLWHEHPPRVSVHARTDGEWVELVPSIVGHPYPVQLDPEIEPYAYDYLQLTIGFKPALARELRIEIERPQDERQWILTEVQLFTEEKSLESISNGEASFGS